MNRPILLALPICVATICLGFTTAAPELGGTLLVLTLVATLVGPRLEVDRGRQWVTSLVGGSIGFSLAAILVEATPGALAIGWTRTSATLLLAASARLLLVAPDGGRSVLLALATGGMVAAGEARFPRGYPIAVAAFVVALLLGFREGDEGRPALREVSRRSAGILALILATGLGVCVGSAVGLRKMQAWITHRLEQRFLTWRPETGFSDTMSLGALDGLQDSDRVVMRLRGPATDYLRGAAFDLYQTGRWVHSDPASQTQKVDLVAPPRGPETTEIQFEEKSTDRLFLPIAARGIGAESSELLLDPLGVLKSPSRGGASTTRFTIGERDNVPISPPTFADQTIPRRIRAEMYAIAQRWSEGAMSPEEKLDAIERRLVLENSYARTFTREETQDPLLDFVNRDHHGHCEYFASALALLARGVGIPSRVVTGYRVAEYVSQGKYWVVREKNAHAWVEVWLDDRGWVTRDPTPPAGVPQDRKREATFVSAMWDLGKVEWAAFQIWLSNRTLEQTAMAVVLGLIALVAVILRGMRRTSPENAVRGDYAPPLVCFTRLLIDLERRGVVRRPSESLETFASRLAKDDATLVLRYAALRYGDVGEERAIADEIESFLMRGQQPRTNTETSGSR